MRTTIRIDDELYRTLKQRAAASGRPVSAVIEDAIRSALAAPSEADDEAWPALPTFGGSGVVAGVDLADNVALRDVMDGDEAVDALR